MPRALTSTTSVTPGTRSRMIRSMPALRVWVDAGQVTQAPWSSTVTTPVDSSTSMRSMSPSSAWMAGRMILMIFSTAVRTGPVSQRPAPTPTPGGGVGALHDERGRARALDPGSHAAEELAEIEDFGLPCCVVDHGGALGGNCGHQQVLGGPHAGELQHDPPAQQLGGRGLDIAVHDVHHRAQLHQSLHMHVYGSGTEVVAPGQGHLGPTAAGQHRPEDHHRGPEPLHDVVGGHRADLRGHIDVEHRRVRPVPLDRAAHIPEKLGHEVDVDDAGHVVEAVRALGQLGVEPPCSRC